MAKVFPDFQTFLDTRDGDIIGVTKVTMVSGTDYFVLPNATDARILSDTYGGAIPNFYLHSDHNRFTIDANSGEKYTVVSRHRGFVNYGDET